MSTVKYSFPLTKRGRLLLKLKNLYSEIKYWRDISAAQSIREYLQCIFNILLLLERIDIRMEIKKELEKIKDTSSLELTLLQSSGKFGENLRSKPLFSQLQKRMSQPGGLCDFDMPALHTWLQLDNDEQIRRLNLPCEEINKLGGLIDSLFSYYKSVEEKQIITSSQGFTTLSPKNSSSLLNLFIPIEYKTLTPEVSASPKAVIIKFWHQYDLFEKPEASAQCFDFKYSEF